MTYGERISRDDWDDLLTKLRKHTCRCGAEYVEACSPRCKGDQRDVTMLDALQTIITYLREQAEPQRPERPTLGDLCEEAELDRG